MDESIYLFINYEYNDVYIFEIKVWGREGNSILSLSSSTRIFNDKYGVYNSISGHEKEDGRQKCTVDRPRGQAERGIKRERTLRTGTDLVYKDPPRRSRGGGEESERRR